MQKRQIIDFVPVTRQGEIIYIPGRPALNGFGAVTQVQLQQTTQALSAATSALPNKPMNYQSNFSKAASTIGTVAALVAVIPGIGWVAAAVCGVIAGVCFLLGKLFGNSKAKKYAAERAQYDALNAQIRYENQQMDLQYVQADAAIRDLRNVIGELSGTPTLNGLGSKASREKARLQSAKDEYDLLSKEQQTKSQLLMSTVDEFNKLMKNKFDLTQSKSINDSLGWILGGSAVVLGGFYAYQNRTKIKKQLSK